jgi:hypothetical protein
MKFLPIRVGVFCTVLLGATAHARADAMPMMQFNERIEKWLGEQQEPPPLTYFVEGIIKGSSSERLRLEKANEHVIFQLKTELPVLAHKRATVELTGKLHFSKQKREFTFDVLAVREVPSDLDKFHDMRRKLPQDSPEKWYDLGQWAKTRGTFYNDAQLLTRSDEAYRQGFDLERKALARDDPEGLLTLVEKARKFQLSSALRGELAHEAFHLLCAKSGKLPPAALEDLAERMTGYLQDCKKVPDRPLHSELMKNYKDRPLETYAAADEATRKKIHRLLYSDLKLRTITPGLAADGSNGFEIAAQIDQEVPEQKRLAESFRDRALAAMAADIDNMTRSQMLDLADRYRERQRNKEADRLIESWLTLKIRALDADDTEGLLELTDEYKKLLKQYDFANRLLIDAWKRNPKATDIAEQLEKDGFHRDGNNWLSAAEYNNRPEGQIEKAIRAGRVEPGMSPSQVRRSLGEPAAQARVVTAGQVTEVWRYEVSESIHLIVRFVRRAGQTEMAVIDVSSPRAVRDR